LNSYSRSGRTYPDRTEACCTTIFLIVIVVAFFAAAGGFNYLIPQENPEHSQLYRMTIEVTPTVGNLTQDFQLDVIVFNESVIEDRFRIIAHNGTSRAKATGNVLWSLNIIDGIVIEIDTITPVDFGFHWYRTIESTNVLELPPSHNNKWHWYFDYGLYGVDVQLGPRFTEGD
jgi:hypothetical protein